MVKLVSKVVQQRPLVVDQPISDSQFEFSEARTTPSKTPSKRRPKKGVFQSAFMLLALVLMPRISHQSKCQFQWVYPEVNEFRSSSITQVIFFPEDTTEDDFDEFVVKYKQPNVIPVITVTNSLISLLTPEIRQDLSQDVADYLTITDNGSEWEMKISNLGPKSIGNEIEFYSFNFILQAPAFQHKFDPANIECTFLKDSATVYTATDSDVDVGPYFVELPSSQNTLTVATSDSSTGSSATLTLSYTTVFTFLEQSWILITLPKANKLYSSNSGQAVSFVTDSTKESATVTIGGVSHAIASGAYLEIGSGYTFDTWAFTFSSATTFSTIGQAVSISIPITNPEMVYDLTDDWTLLIKTEMGNYPACTSCTYPTDYATYEQAASTISGGVDVTTVTETSSSTTAQIMSGDSLGAEDSTYRFTVSPTLSIPTEGVMVLTVPSGVTVPSNDVSGFTMTCIEGCTTSGTLSYDSPDLTIEDAFGSYLVGGSSSVSFELTGWTNPTSTTTQDFSLATFFDDGSTQYGIENFTGLELGAADGVCYVQYANVTDADTRIYGQPYGYSFQMWCSHDLTTDMGLQVVFPSDYIVMDRSSCTFFLEGYTYSRYICATYASTNTIQVTSFLGADIAAETVMKFTIDSVINPGTYGATGEIKINTIDASETVVDQGAWIFDAGYFSAGTITKFTVSPQSSGVGEDPVKYDFNVQPNGEIPRYGYLEIDLPDEVTITNERYFEDSCGENLEAFTNEIYCVVLNSKRTIQIKGGYQFEATTNLTDSDGLYFPPDIIFTLEGFKNPRVTGHTSPWNVTVYNNSQKALYYWQTVDAPTFRVSGIAAPAYMEPFFENRQNGAFSYIEFLVTTTGGLAAGDRIVLKLPSGWQFSTESEVLGRSNNMAALMESSISSDQRQIEFTVELAATVQRLLTASARQKEESEFLPPSRQLQARLDPGYSFQFRVSEMKNFYSLRPSTESIEYYVYSADGVLFEEQTSGMPMANLEVGRLDPAKNGVLPADFRTDFAAAYTLTLQVSNFETNMAFTLFLPDEINFTDDDPQCFGVAGTDEDVLRCETRRSTRSLRFTNAMQFKQANPGALTILIENLMNPADNVVTGSFGLTTETADGYAMDELYEGITINFYCEYPCAQCPESAPSTCEACYQTAVERYFYEAQCLSECPDGMVETEELSCTDCISPCVTCNGTPNSCVTCIEGWYIVNGDECREEIFWPFPFVGSALFFFVLISISECATKRASNFKESLIAFWSLPEVGSWGTLIYFMWDKIGVSPATGIAVLAALIYACINCVHAILHPRYMVPNALDSYKKVLADYACGSAFARTISYLLSFKFSLILVSNFFGSNRLKGDYSAMNWKQFNRFSLFFCILPYPIMMASCIIFIATEDFWSYAGFVAAEVVCLSSIMTILLAIDAISAIKCKTVGKRKVVKEVNVATAADYESDEDERNLKRQVRDAHRLKEEDVFGADDYDVEDDSYTDLRKTRHTRGRVDSQQSYKSQLSQQTAIMNDEARKQIQMLEELAHQMREEKRQLQLDKERIEREKMELDADRSRSQSNIETYMQDYQRQAMVLNNQVAEMERQKVDLVQQVETRLEEGNRANLILALKVQEAQQLSQKKEIKNFRDFEGEMDDYEPVEEADSNEEEEPSVRDMVQVPVEPAKGRIDYYRTVEESAQWMQQITPRAGGVSMLGDDQHMGMSDDMELAMEKNATAHFETASVPPSMTAIEMGKGRHDAEFQELTSQIEAAQSEEYHQRSDAEMEIDSEIQQKYDGMGQEYFERERAIYSAVGDRVEKDAQAEFFTNVEDAIYEQLEKPATRHGNEQRYFDQIGPNVGDADQRSDVFGSTQHFFKPEPPTYEVDDEGSVELQATDQHFFNQETAQKGIADDVNRQGEATPEEFINREKHLFGDDVSAVPSREDAAERLFNLEQAVKDDASNIGRSQLGSEMIYQEREGAYLDDKEWNEKKSKLGSQQEFFNRENALYSQNVDGAEDKNATETQFFKHDEAIRGDVTSHDRSVAGTQMDYFKNVDTAELGRPDTYSVNKSASGSEFINKSDLARGATRNNQGLSTPYRNKEAEPVEYMNKSEAEYGRPDSVMERDATMSKFFEQEQNPQFGRGDQYSRKAEEEKEYMPTPESDQSGRSESESSEGGIANHSPFTSAVVVIPKTKGLKPSPSVGQEAFKISQPANQTDPNLEQVKKVLQGNPGVNPRKFEEDTRNMPDAAAAIMPSPVKSRGGNRAHKAPLNMTQQQVPGQVTLDPTTPQMLEPATQQNLSHQQRQQAKTILYSDKSETSVEDLMDDTPSNYNVANGRFEGKSLGLKAMLLHAKKYQNQSPEINADKQLSPNNVNNGNLASQPVLPHVAMAGGEPKPNLSPQHTRPGHMLAPGMIGAQKGIIGSQNDERKFVNNLYQSQHSMGGQSSVNQWRANGPMNASRAVTIDADISADGDNSQMRNTRSVVRTNKQFMEDPRSLASGVSPGADLRQYKGRGAPKVTKNNYFNATGSIN